MSLGLSQRLQLRAIFTHEVRCARAGRLQIEYTRDRRARELSDLRSLAWPRLPMWPERIAAAQDRPKSGLIVADSDSALLALAATRSHQAPQPSQPQHDQREPDQAAHGIRKFFQRFSFHIV